MSLLGFLEIESLATVIASRLKLKLANSTIQRFARQQADAPAFIPGSAIIHVERVILRIVDKRDLVRVLTIETIRMPASFVERFGMRRPLL